MSYISIAQRITSAGAPPASATTTGTGEPIYIYSNSSITPQQICKLLPECPERHVIYIKKPTCISVAVLVELACSCPHLQKVTLGSSEVTEEGVLALAVHCRQLQELEVPLTIVTEETVRQLAQHCRHLTMLCVFRYCFEVKCWLVKRLER